MITPGLLRRSFGRASQWRLLLLAPALLLLPALATLVPALHFFNEQLGRSPRWRELTPWLDSPAVASLLQQLMMPAGSGVFSGLVASALIALFVTPVIAGAALAVARADEELAIRPLLAGAAEYYGRLLRMQVAALLPLAIAGGACAGAAALSTRAVRKAVTEAQATNLERLAMAGGGLVIFLAHLVLDAGRAWFAAQPSRRSALFALGAGVKLVVRRPLRALWIGLCGAVAGFGAAAVLFVLRQQIPQAGVATVAVAFVLAQLAVGAIAWGHAARLIGLTELARADAADRARTATFEMAPPRTSPPPPAAVIAAAAPEADLSRKDP